MCQNPQPHRTYSSGDTGNRQAKQPAQSARCCQQINRVLRWTKLGRGVLFRGARSELLMGGVSGGMLNRGVWVLPGPRPLGAERPASNIRRTLQEHGTMIRREDKQRLVLVETCFWISSEAQWKAIKGSTQGSVLASLLISKTESRSEGRQQRKQRVQVGGHSNSLGVGSAGVGGGKN